MKKVIDFINKKVDTRLLLFIIFAVSTLSFRLSGNEENYLAYAKKAYFPDWMPHTEIFNEFSGTRIVFQYLFGWLFHFFGFSMVSLIGRILLITLIVFPLNKIIKHLQIQNIALLLIIPLWIPFQALFAGGWMIGAFETKVLAYISALWAIYLFWKDRYLSSIILQIAALYFHVLVGGWFATIFIFCFFRKLGFKTIKYYLIYGIAVLPMLIYLASGFFNDTFKATDVNLDWVYSYFRNPHHVAPFKTMVFFFAKFFPGVAISIVLFIIHILVYKKNKNTVLQNLAFFNIILFSQQIVALTVAYFDVNGAFLKTYPFRTSVFYFLFSLFEITVLISQNRKFILEIIFKNNTAVLKYSSYVLFFFILTFSSVRLYKKKIKGNLHRYNPYLEQTAEYMRTTPDNATFMFLCKRSGYLSLPRRSERNFYVIYKFVPTQKSLLYKWYKAILFENEVKENIDILGKKYKKEGIDYLITDYKIEKDFLQLEYQNTAHFCYKLVEVE